MQLIISSIRGYSHCDTQLNSRTKNALIGCLSCVLLLLLQGCAAPTERNASIHSELMNPLDTSGLRFWDEYRSETENYNVVLELEALIENKQISDEVNHLALSGGGVNGAFSAGILNAWSEQGTRPDFDVVTGVSTGAIVAVFAYLGAEYDTELKHYYTQTPVSDMFRRNSLITLLSRNAFVDTTGFERKVRKAIDSKMMERLSIERQKGRILLIGTTNLDNQKMALWDIGRIAQVNTSEAQALIQNIVIASSSIPGAFPAKVIPLSYQGETYDELHVDGGISRQVFLIPQWINKSIKTSARAQNIYVIRNGSLKPRFNQVESGISSVSASSIATLIRRQGVGDVEYIYHYSERNGYPFNLAHIDDDFVNYELDPLSLDYMNAVYEYGFNKMKDNALWLAHPPSIPSPSNTVHHP
ncbi:patatin-like phospholipase family protein [Vibrio rarus]|uniref:patatin-like phospholipase family protein n=1 Tax=Vibrio rarus TaxID=413403 RepID=UPI0021C27513|nr:patatin-like phospholipase family protein [Vibrio rarus]